MTGCQMTVTWDLDISHKLVFFYIAIQWPFARSVFMMVAGNNFCLYWIVDKILAIKWDLYFCRSWIQHLENFIGSFISKHTTARLVDILGQVFFLLHGISTRWRRVYNFTCRPSFAIIKWGWRLPVALADWDWQKSRHQQVFPLPFGVDWTVTEPSQVSGLFSKYRRNQKKYTIRNAKVSLSLSLTSVYKFNIKIMNV